jgi:hypothetical protein
MKPRRVGSRKYHQLRFSHKYNEDIPMASVNATLAAAAAAAAIANAIKASGSIVQVAPRDFYRLLKRTENPLIVYAEGRGFFSKNYQYLMHYKGLAFFTKSDQALPLPEGAETVLAQKIWIPQ